MKTRYLKCHCASCGYIARVTRTHLRETGEPICPCNREPMRCEQWEEIAREEIDAWEAEAMVKTVARVVREVERVARKAHRCSGCPQEIQPGHRYLERTIRYAGAGLETHKECEACRWAPETRQFHRAADMTYESDARGGWGHFD